MAWTSVLFHNRRIDPSRSHTTQLNSLDLICLTISEFKLIVSVAEFQAQDEFGQS